MTKDELQKVLDGLRQLHDDVVVPAAVEAAEAEARRLVPDAVRYYMRNEGWRVPALRTWRFRRYSFTIARSR